MFGRALRTSCDMDDLSPQYMRHALDQRKKVLINILEFVDIFRLPKENHEFDHFAASNSLRLPKPQPYETTARYARESHFADLISAQLTPYENIWSPIVLTFVLSLCCRAS